MLNGASHSIWSCLGSITLRIYFSVALNLLGMLHWLHMVVQSTSQIEWDMIIRDTPSAILIPILKTLSTIAGGVVRHTDALLSYRKLLHTVCKFLDLPHASRVVYNALWLVSNIAEKNYKQVIVGDADSHCL